MKKQQRIKYIHEGEYVAEVGVELLDMDKEWAPYLSLQDAYKLDDVRSALRRGDLKAASQQRACSGCSLLSWRIDKVFFARYERDEPGQPAHSCVDERTGEAFCSRDVIFNFYSGHG